MEQQLFTPDLRNKAIVAVVAYEIFAHTLAPSRWDVSRRVVGLTTLDDRALACALCDSWLEMDEYYETYGERENRRN